MVGQGEASVNILAQKWSERVCQKCQACVLSWRRMSAVQINTLLSYSATELEQVKCDFRFKKTKSKYVLLFFEAQSYVILHILNKHNNNNI